MDDVLTVAEVAQRLKLADRTVHAMLAAGEMPGFKIRGQWRLRRAVFEQWLDGISGAGTLSSGEFHVTTESSHQASLASGQLEMPDLRASFQNPAREAGDRRLTIEQLNRAFVDALGDSVLNHSSLGAKPLDLELSHPMPGSLRVYLFNATKPAGGRPIGEHKIQLILPKQKRGERGRFESDQGRFIVLAGYAPEDEVFVLWDAGLYDDFAYSRNVQVKASTILQASITGVAEQERLMRPKGAPAVAETVLAASPSNLGEALARRVALTISRL